MREYETLDEQVAVLVSFNKDKKYNIRPLRLRWRNRDYNLTNIAHYYRYKEGIKTIHVIAANDGINFFELRVDSENMIWTLGRVADNETH
jgi:hypothetical protein